MLKYFCSDFNSLKLLFPVLLFHKHSTSKVVRCSQESPCQTCYPAPWHVRTRKSASATQKKQKFGEELSEKDNFFRTHGRYHVTPFVIRMKNAGFSESHSEWYFSSLRRTFSWRYFQTNIRTKPVLNARLWNMNLESQKTWISIASRDNARLIAVPVLLQISWSFSVRLFFKYKFTASKSFKTCFA